MPRMPSATPFLKPAVETASAELRAEIRERLKEMSTKAMQEMFVGATATAPMRGLRAMMADPAEPWPYGTVLRLKEHPNRPVRVMSLGTGQCIQVAGPKPLYTVRQEIENFAPEHWEPAPEPDL